MSNKGFWRSELWRNPKAWPRWFPTLKTASVTGLPPSFSASSPELMLNSTPEPSSASVSHSTYSAPFLINLKRRASACPIGWQKCKIFSRAWEFSIYWWIASAMASTTSEGKHLLKKSLMIERNLTILQTPAIAWSTPELSLTCQIFQSSPGTKPLISLTPSPF